ncbi:MAG: cytochrome oxidase small assembly protein [Telluria sp.]
MPEPKKPNNVRTGLIIAGIALFFFVMVFVKRIWLA